MSQGIEMGITQNFIEDIKELCEIQVFYVLLAPSATSVTNTINKVISGDLTPEAADTDISSRCNVLIKYTNEYAYNNQYAIIFYKIAEEYRVAAITYLDAPNGLINTANIIFSIKLETFLINCTFKNSKFNLIYRHTHVEGDVNDVIAQENLNERIEIYKSSNPGYGDIIPESDQSTPMRDISEYYPISDEHIVKLNRGNLVLNNELTQLISVRKINNKLEAEAIEIDYFDAYSPKLGNQDTDFILSGGVYIKITGNQSKPNVKLTAIGGRSPSEVVGEVIISEGVSVSSHGYYVSLYSDGNVVYIAAGLQNIVRIKAPECTIEISTDSSLIPDLSRLSSSIVIGNRNDQVSVLLDYETSVSQTLISKIWNRDDVTSQIELATNKGREKYSGRIYGGIKSSRMAEVFARHLYTENGKTYINTISLVTELGYVTLNEDLFLTLSDEVKLAYNEPIYINLDRNSSRLYTIVSDYGPKIVAEFQSGDSLEICNEICKFYADSSTDSINVLSKQNIICPYYIRYGSEDNALGFLPYFTRYWIKVINGNNVNEGKCSSFSTNFSNGISVFLTLNGINYGHSINLPRVRTSYSYCDVFPNQNQLEMNRFGFIVSPVSPYTANNLLWALQIIP